MLFPKKSVYKNNFVKKVLKKKNYYLRKNIN